MRKLILILTMVVSFAYAQDTSKWNKATNYGMIFERLKASKVMLLPMDTTYNKYGVATIGNALFVGNGVKWTATGADTTSLSSRINDRIKYSDSAAMLAPYLRTANYSPVDTSSLSNRINARIKYSDSAAMLSPYLRTAGYGLIKSSQSLLVDSSLLSTKAWRQKGLDSLGAVKVGGSGANGQVAYWNGTNTQTGTNNLFWDNTNFRLGVGTASPLARLHVYDGANGVSFLLETNNTTSYSEIAARNAGSVSTSYFRQYSSSATGTDFNISRVNLATFFSNYASNFAIGTQNGGSLMLATANTERLRINTNGNIGINTTVDAGYLLDVNGTARVVGNLTNDGTIVSNNATMMTNGSTGGVSITTTNNRIYINASANVRVTDIGSISGTLNLRTNGTIQSGAVFNFAGGLSGATGLGYNLNINSTNSTQTGGNVRILNIEPTLSTDNATSTFKGIYYNPTISGLLANTSHNAIETVTGNVILGSTSGETVIGSSTTTGAKLSVGGSVTAASAIARGQNITSTLTAAANNDVLVGLDVNPTFTNGAFTGVQNHAARIQGNTVIGATTYSTMLYSAIPKLFVNGGTYLNSTVLIGTNSIQFSGNNVTWEATGIANNLPEWRADATGVKFGNYLSLPLRISVNQTENARFFSTGNVAIGTTTDAGYKLDVNGTARVQGAITGTTNISITGATATPQIAGTLSYASSITGQLNGAISSQAIASLYVTNPTYSGSGGSLNSYAIYANASYFDKLNVGITYSNSNQTNIISDLSNTPLRLQGYNVLTGASGVGSGSLLLTERLSGTMLGIAATYGGGGSRLTIFNQYSDGPTSRILINMNSVNTACFFADGSLQIGNGETTIASALLSATSTTRGFLPPRMTTTQKNAISSPATGLMVYDTTLNKLCVFTGTVWETITSL